MMTSVVISKGKAMQATPLQLSREIRLAIVELTLLADAAIGETAGLRMLGMEDTSDFAQSRHPDDLPNPDGFSIGQAVERLRKYVHEQVWDDRIAQDIRWVGVVVERVFSPAVLAEYAADKDADVAALGAERVDIPAPFEEGSGEIPFCYFHLGLLDQLVRHAQARLKVDQDERLTMSEMALLTGKRDANLATTAHRKVFPTYEENGKRYAEVTDVLPWLEANGYIPTKGVDYHDIPESAYASVEEYFFVPVAKDGSAFLPNCASGGRFTLGEKGAEQKVDDYFVALETLQRMRTPRWRRPGPSGVPGIVTGVRFERMSRREIERS